MNHRQPTSWKVAQLWKTHPNVMQDEAVTTDAGTADFQQIVTWCRLIVDADAELTLVPTQDCPTPSRQKSSIGKGREE